MSSTPLLDPEMVSSLKTLLGEKFNFIVSAFLSDTTTRFSQLSDAVKSGDLEKVRTESHGIKGSSKNIGANTLADICAEIEDQARAGDGVNLEKKVAAAEQIFADVSEALRSLME